MVGAIWTFHFSHGPKQKSEDLDLHLRVYNYGIYRGPKKVGYVTPKGNRDAEIFLTELPRMKGSATITKTRYADPVAWSGTFKQDDGTEWRLRISEVEE